MMQKKYVWLSQEEINALGNLIDYNKYEEHKSASEELYETEWHDQDPDKVPIEALDKHIYGDIRRLQALYDRLQNKEEK